MSLTAKEAAFVAEYLIDLNATQAAIRAGYSEKTAGAIGAENLKKPHIAAAIADAMDARAKRTLVTADRVVRELAKIGFADIRRVVNWTGNQPGMDVEACEEDEEVEITAANFVRLFDSAEIADDMAGAIAEISQTKDGMVKVKLHDKQAALVNLGKHLGMFTTKVEHSGTVDVHHKVQEDADAVTSAIAGLAERARAARVAGATQH
ncbi:MAG TPA: terminase small subunit [Sphingomicrobium sp.]|nr:terminase small subunit [Sphingomicrobium sp.]